MAKNSFSGATRVIYSADQTLENGQIHQESGYTGYDIEVCDIHKYKIVQYFCKFHDQVICDVCRSTDHVSCSDVSDIDNACNHWSQQAEFYLDKTQTLITSFQGALSDTAQAISDLRRQEVICCKDIEKLRQKLNKDLDDLERDLYEQVINTVNTCVESLSSQKTSAENAIRALKQTTSNLQFAKSSGQDRHVFIAVKKANHSDIEEVFNDIEQEIYQVEIDVEPDQMLIAKLCNRKKLGRVVVNKASSQHFPGTVVRERENAIDLPMKDRNVIKIGEFSVADSTDKMTCNIGGSQFLDDGHLLLTDWCNMKLKLLDDHLKLKSSIELNGLFDVTLISQQEAVVTIPFFEKLQFVEVLPELRLAREANTDTQCYGITCHNNMLFTACLNRGKLAVLVVDLQGHRETIITTSEEGQDGGNMCIAVDNTGRLYISDQFVLCITRQGETVYKYSNNELQYPCSLLVDTDSSVFVCGYWSDNVQVINSEGKKYRTLIRPREGRVVFLQSLAYRCTDRTLVGGMANYNNIIAFRLQ